MTTQAAAVEPDSGEDAAQQELEARARRMGWKSKDEYRGPVDQWTEAAAFITRTEEQAPLRNERLRFLDDKLEKSVRATTQLNARLESQQRTINEQGEFIKKNLGEIVNRGRRAEAGAFERQRATIKAAIKAAGKSGDDAEVDRLTDELVSLESNRPDPAAEEEDERKPAPQTQQRPPTADEVEAQITPSVKAWIARRENSWFKTDPLLNGVAVMLHGQNVNSGMSEEESLDAVSKEIRRRYSDKFENDRRETPSTVSTPAPPGNSKPKGKTVNDLPPEAQLALEQLKRLIPDYTNAQYLETYKW